jgi:hypothetical protein
LVEKEISGMNGKIFALGLSKTGTSSLHEAFKQLGFESKHYPRYPELFAGKFDWLDKYDAVSDIPIAPFYPQLDEAYPGSKFILTVRNVDDWLKSIEKWLAIWEDPDEYALRARILVFGVHTFHAGRMRYVYEKHITDVQQYFKDRPGDLLIMNICERDGWEKLCPFLNKPVPDRPFPFVMPGKHRNKPKKKKLLGLFRVSK